MIFLDRSDVITLVGETYTQDEIGQYTAVETERMVFCNVMSITQTEFFEAGRNGIQPSYKVVLFKYDYQNEEIVKYKDRRYSIYRTYEARNDMLELYLQEESGVTHG